MNDEHETTINDGALSRQASALLALAHEIGIHVLACEEHVNRLGYRSGKVCREEEQLPPPSDTSKVLGRIAQSVSRLEDIASLLRTLENDLKEMI
jgi:hypothetical protein